MLRIIQNRNAARAKSYYSTADYYSEGQELAGLWRGQGAEKLGLAGEIQRADWDALCENRIPATGERLTSRDRIDRTVAYDFNFHVPKSVSLLYATTRDERVLEAFHEAVRSTMHDMESEMRTRVRKDHKDEERVSGNMVWGEFTHFTSRPVDGIPDPHLHAHCFVFSATYDGEEHTWKAGQFRELKRDAPYFEAVFHSRLAQGLVDLGLPVERTEKGWELGGVSEDLIKKFSRRTAQIEERAKEKGIRSAELKAEIGAETRERKKDDLTFSELQDAWRSRMSKDERVVLSDLARKVGSTAGPRDEAASHRAVSFAIDHCFERSSVVAERQVLRAALRQSVGEATVEQVHRATDASGLIVAERGGRRMVTTRGVLQEERSLIRFARDGRGTCKPFAPHDRPFVRDGLKAEQRQAVRDILTSRDRVQVLRGAAGVGKTWLMQETVEAIEQSGTKVFALAPSAAASRGVLRSEGFAEADTVAKFLLDEQLQQQAAGQLIWVDEAGLLGTRTMARLFDVAERIEARVLLTGDPRQHGSVERGAALRLLEEEAGLVPAEVKEIRRQRGEYKEAVKALSEGRTADGFSQLDQLGWVKEVPEDERYRQLAADYVAAVAAGKTALVISPTHKEGESCTAEIRNSLRQAKLISNEEQPIQVLENAYLTEAERGDRLNLRKGDVIQFEQNAKGFLRGDRLVVDGKSKAPTSEAKRFQVYRAKEVGFSAGDVIRITHNGKTADGAHRLDNGALYRIKRFDDAGNIVLQNDWVIAKGYGHLSHGVCVTSHNSQGKTVDVAIIGQSSDSFPASSREQFYVSCSRAKERVVIYTDDREALRQAVGKSDDRVTATELVTPLARSPMKPREREPARSLELLPDRERGDERDSA